MIEGRGEAVIGCSPEAVVAFVTDLERYKLADLKIGRVFEQRREGNTVFMRHDGTLRGIPGPAVSLELVVESPLRVRYHGLPGFTSRWVLAFDGGFELTVEPEGTRVVHVERFRFHLPWRLVAEPFLRRWLQADVEAEMVRMKALLEGA